jgi:hypothetical protein
MRRPGRFFLVACAAALAALTMTCGVREDELRCEEAVARLKECCDGFDVHRIDCYYAATGCGTYYPAITISESRCITSESCATIVATGVCSRGQNAEPNPNHSVTVCP